MSPKDVCHLLMMGLPSWGHVRSLCVLGARLVFERDNVIVTILTSPNLLKMAHSEVARLFRDGSKQASLQIRIVSMFDSNSLHFFELMKPFVESYPGFYQSLSQAKPITCATTGTTLDAVPAPVAVIMDYFAFPQLCATRAISGRSVPVIGWMTGGTSTIIRLFGPESIGGRGDLGKQINDEAARTNKSPEEVGDQLIRHTDGTVVNIPGLPPMHDYEFFPQKLLFEVPVSPVIKGTHAFIMECDGAITSTPEVYEKTSLNALKSWFSDLSKPFYAVGPLLPPNYGSASNEGDTEVEAFLESKLAQHGKRSVLFMTFGTTFWPTRPEYVDEAIEAILEKKFPFIFCHASPFAKVSAEMVEKIQNSGLGMLTTWSPQQFILNHPATGWFLTHGGHGSVIESLASGVPIICWPFDADQPANAAHLSQNLRVAFELIQIRTGPGLNPAYRNKEVPKGTREAVGIEFRQVLDACRGEEGAEKTHNAERLKEELAKAWEENGAGKREMRAFLDKFVKSGRGPEDLEKKRGVDGTV